MGIETLFYIIAASIVNGLVGLIGAVTLWLKEKSLNRILIILVAFSAGALMGGGFFHMLAESLEMMEPVTAFSYFMIGFVVFFLIERFLHWHHCHERKECKVHPFSQLILIGDGIHNFIDGLVIAASFMVNPAFGALTTLMIILHEIPQELGDFGVLVYGGYGRTKALVYNFMVQLTCIAGGIMGFFLLYTPESIGFVLPFAAGGFIYIAASDLIPELHKEENLSKSMLSFTFFVIGILFLLGVKIFLGA